MPVFKFNVVKGNIMSKLQSPASARLQKCREKGYSQGLDFAVMSGKTTGQNKNKTSDDFKNEKR